VVLINSVIQFWEEHHPPKKWTETDGMPGYSRQTKPPRDQPSKETKETWQLQKTEPSQDSKLNFSKGARFKLTQMLKQ
jgi:hypothetical protein